MTRAQSRTLYDEVYSLPAHVATRLLFCALHRCAVLRGTTALSELWDMRLIDALAEKRLRVMVERLQGEVRE
jgi:hypothetical protein